MCTKLTIRYCHAIANALPLAARRTDTKLMDEIKHAAIQEILNPVFGTTQQFLQVFKVHTENDNPVIRRIKIDQSNKSATVYLPVQDETFFVAIYFDIGNQIKIRSVETEAGTSVYLSVGILNQIQSELPLKPDKIYKDFKIYGIDIDEPDDLESKITKLLDYLEPHKETILQISKANSVTINIQYFGYRDQMWGMHLDPVIMKRIIDLNAELDLDIYAEGKELY